MLKRQTTLSEGSTAIFAMILIMLIVGPVSAIDTPAVLTPEAVVSPKADIPLSDAVREALLDRDGDIVKLWVFFTDKGVFDNTEFAARAATVVIAPRALKRRAKVGRDYVVFADLPVLSEYVDGIVDMGGRLRRVSRWLNAASYELPADLLDQVAALPYVAKLKPVTLYKRAPLPEETPDRPESPPKQSLGADALNYGVSFNQLNQINVPPVHEKGFSGSGVTLAIFDTGFRKSHVAFAAHYVEGRVLAEWDFIFNDGNTANEGADWSSQWNHGTYIWSTSGGLDDGTLYGPAYRSDFILCKTEDIRSETQVEEDNWVAALEWVDSLGADVVTSSLSYMGWDDGTGYTPADLDGWTAVTSIAASMAADMGIVVCNSAGNSGPSPSTLGAPADAFDMLTIGAVDASGFLAGFSSRGPTADLRIKPEVTARGVSTSCAVATSDASYGAMSGTSLSAPLVAGAACLLIEAKPYYTPRQIRWALMETANNAATPNNDVGWGLIDLDAALSWGANFGSDITIGNAPATVQFYDSSTVTPLAWTWAFGDGDSSSLPNPSHLYNNPGAYEVMLSIETDSMGIITETKEGYIILLADTLIFAPASGVPGSEVVVSINLKNSQELSRLTIPFKFDSSPFLVFDSATLGDRTLYFEYFQLVGFIPSSNSYAYELQADDGGGQPPLAAGDGEIMQLHFSIDALAPLGTTIVIDTTSSPKVLEVTSEFLVYAPAVIEGTLGVTDIVRGDVNGDLVIDIGDLIYLIDYMFTGGPPPVSEMAGDVDGSGQLDISDLVYLVDYMFNDGPPPPA